MSAEYILVEDLEIVRETEKAICVRHDYLDDNEVIWLPRSQIGMIDKHGKKVDIYMSAWIAKEKDLI